MMFGTLRARLLLAVLLPVALVALALALLYWHSRSDDASLAHASNARLLLRQVAMASEYGLFSGNLDGLQGVVNAVQSEAGVSAAAVFDSNGALLVHAGVLPSLSFKEIVHEDRVTQQRQQGVDLVYQAITPGQVELGDVYEQGSVSHLAPTPALGYAVVAMSRQGFLQRQRELIYFSLALGLLALTLGGLLALRLSQGLVRPMLRVADMIERVGRGELTARLEVDPNDPLRGVQRSLNSMAQSLGAGRDELEQRVQDATHELLLKKIEAEAATLAKSRFLAAASHDLRQPTHALGLFVERLGQLPLDGQARHLVQQLEAVTHASQDLLDGLLDISMLDAGVVPVHVGTFGLQQVMETVQSSLAPLAAAKGLRLRVRSTPLWTRTDPAILRRMVMNLVHNAVRYTERGSVLVACRSTDAGRRVSIEVWDSGIGIAPDQKSEIFKEFYQIGNPARARERGTGLGLNIVQRNAQLLGLGVSVQSELGRGSRFAIVVPSVRAQEQAPPGVADVPPVLDGGGLHVMVIDDDDLAREAIVMLLNMWGYTVTAARSALHARELVQKGVRPALVLSDYRLGESGDGFQAIAGVRALLDEDIPACLISGDTDATLVQQAQSRGLTLLLKPVRPAKLRSLVRRMAQSTTSANVVDVVSGDALG